SPAWEGPAEGTALVFLPRFPEFRSGDTVTLTGDLETPPDFAAFSYRAYLARRGIYSLLRYPRARLVSRTEDEGPLAIIAGVRGRLHESIARILPEPQGALAGGLLLGARTRIPDDVVAAFQTTGTSHILAISGLHVSIVVGLVGGLSARLFGRRKLLSAAVTALAIVGYALLAGAGPSVQRAAVMGILALLATQLGRPRDGLVGLAFACLLLTAIHPQTLLEVGFQLSALATAGLIVLAPRLRAFFGRLPDWIAATSSVTLAAQLAVLPVVVINFRQLSLVSLFTNVLAVPVLPGALEWSAVAAVAGLVWAPIGTACGWVAWAYLSALVWLVENAARFPYAAIAVDAPHPALAWLYYAGILVGLYGRWPDLSPVRGAASRFAGYVPSGRVLTALAVAAAIVAAALWQSRGDGLHVTVLDVGQGDAMLIQTAAGRRVLVDGGPDGVVTANALGRRLPFWDKSLDLVVLTHAHDDHLVGLLDVVRDWQVREVMVGRPPQNQSLAYQEWTGLLDARGIKVTQARTGQEIGLGDGARLRVVHAGEVWDGDDASLNDSSLVLYLEKGASVVALMGDAGPQVQQWLVEKGHVGRVSVLKVPHHGAADALDAQFLEAAAPQAAVISVGAENRFGHPDAEALNLLGSAAVYRTDVHGSVDIMLADTGVHVVPSR
ncbi:MAG: DNA internalization-related competence protein ComEC/Rec2, partial [Dehalococcoidales bacterium]|nr:DNA internalization-related competence protein ComEC/Rec2 [Dehalococcoidales bacterium]